MDISIALDSYDDLFSDFDNRSYGERSLSKDFLDEMKVRLRKALDTENCVLVFSLPSGKRDAGVEEIIVKRVRRFFLERREHHRREYRRTTIRSFIFVSVGILLSFAANLLAGRVSFLPLIREFLLIPAWFFVWSGLELLLQKRSEVARRKRYYAVLAEREIRFDSIAGPVSAASNQA